MTMLGNKDITIKAAEVLEQAADAYDSGQMAWCTLQEEDPAADIIDGRVVTARCAFGAMHWAAEGMGYLHQPWSRSMASPDRWHGGILHVAAQAVVHAVDMPLTVPCLPGLPINSPPNRIMVWNDHLDPTLHRGKTTVIEAFKLAAKDLRNAACSPS